MVTTFTYRKDKIIPNDSTTTLLSHCQRKQNIEEESQGEGLILNGSQEHGRNKDKIGFGNKISKSKNKKTVGFLLQTNHAFRERDWSNKQQCSSNSTNVIMMLH